MYNHLFKAYIQSQKDILRKKLKTNLYENVILVSDQIKKI